jgi:hypothetical protein
MLTLLPITDKHMRQAPFQECRPSSIGEHWLMEENQCEGSMEKAMNLGHLYLFFVFRDRRNGPVILFSKQECRL